MSDLTDQTLTCKDCQAPFLFSVRDQEFFAAQNFTPPKRCKNCRAVNKAKKEGGGAVDAGQGFNSTGGYSSGGGGGGGGGRRHGGGRGSDRRGRNDDY